MLPEAAGKIAGIGKAAKGGNFPQGDLLGLNQSLRVLQPKDPEIAGKGQAGNGFETATKIGVVIAVLFT